MLRRKALKRKIDQAAPCDSIHSTTDRIRATLRQVAQSQKWLRSVAMIVVVLIVLGMASFALPGLLSQQLDSVFYRIDLDLKVRLLVCLIMVFCIHVIHQQLQIRHIDSTVFSALDKIQDRAERIYKLAGRDSLTDLYNRKFGEQRLEEELSRSRRQVRPLAVLRMGLDGLEKIDEVLGSASTDCAIRLFADHLQGKLRGFDVPVCLDRGEFLILLPECKSGEAEKVLDRLNGMTFEFGEQDRTQILGGWADYVEGDAPQALVMRAESTLHGIKQNGRGGTPPAKISISLSANSARCDGRITNLTPRERQVFELLAQGKCNKDIANSLEISVRTVEVHRASIMSQLDVHSGPDLVIYAIRNGILDVESL